jgi:hypothetical protein
VTEAERIWSEKSDEALIDAAASLGEFTPAGQLIIRAELKRRGLEDPFEQAGENGAQAEEAAPAEVECLRCNVSLHLLDPGDPEAATRWRFMGALQPLMALGNSFNVYVCPQCGHVEVFAHLPIEEGADEESDR